MTALHALDAACAQAGSIPDLGAGVPQTSAELLNRIVADHSPLTGAQQGYVLRLTFILALEAIAHSERVRQALDAHRLPPRSAEQAPSLGRIVFFRSAQGFDYAAIITRVHDGGVCDLDVFNDAGADKPVINLGFISHQDAGLSRGWRWPQEMPCGPIPNPDTAAS